MNGYGDRDFCKNGHEFTRENTRWRTDGHGRRCLACHQERERARRNPYLKFQSCEKHNWTADPNRSIRQKCPECQRIRKVQTNTLLNLRNKKNPTPEDAEKIRAIMAELDVSDSKKVEGRSINLSLHYLSLTPEQRQADKEFDLAVDEVGASPKCRFRWVEWMDRYDPEDESYIGRSATPEEAEEMCAGCPFIQECANLAEAFRPKFGVMGAQAWVNGKVVDARRQEKHHEPRA